MRRMHVAAAVFALLSSTGVAAQNGWVQFANTDGSTAYFDQTSIQPDLSREVAYFAWWRADLASPSVVDGKTFTSHLASYRVDCLRRTLQQRERSFFSAAGKQVGFDGPSSESLPTPNSLGESFVRAICARAGR